MMLAHPQMDTVLNFGQCYVNTMIIENQRFFREFLQDITRQIQGYSGLTVLSQNNQPIDFSKSCELIDDFLTFDISRKSLVTKIIGRMENAAVNEEHYLRTAELMGEIERYILELTFDLPCDVSCSKLGIGNLLRSVGIEIQNDYENDLERLLDYMILTRELERDKLFILVNMRSYYTDEELERFLDTVLGHDLHILLVDSTAGEKLRTECRITIDNDLCEF